MFRPWLRVAIPDDWTGSLARLGSSVLMFLILMGPLLGKMPDAWVELARGHDWVVRIFAVALVAWALMQLKPLAYLPLPKTIVLLGRRLRVPAGLHSRWLKVDDIQTIHVDERPDGEVFTLAMLNGRELELCPVGWIGAGRLYVKLAARVEKARKKRRRERIKRARAEAQKEGKPEPTDLLASSDDGISLAMGPVTHRGGQAE